MALIWSDENLINVLKKNGVAVMPTDTLYGLVGRAENVSTVERIYHLKERTLIKPCIILIGDISELEKFSVTLTPEQKKVLDKYWSFNFTQDIPAPISVVLDCLDDRFSYLHRGTKTLAFRIPYPKPLRDFLLNVGPLIAPSANPEGLPPAEDIFKAREYFGDSVDIYMDGGIIGGSGSQVVRLYKDGSTNVLRR